MSYSTGCSIIYVEASDDGRSLLSIIIGCIGSICETCANNVSVVSLTFHSNILLRLLVTLSIDVMVDVADVIVVGGTVGVDK